MLRLFHKMLNDGSLRGKKEYNEMLLLATWVVRGLFAKLVPPQPYMPATAPLQQQQQQEDEQVAAAAAADQQTDGTARTLDFVDLRQFDVDDDEQGPSARNGKTGLADGGAGSAAVGDDGDDDDDATAAAAAAAAKQAAAEREVKVKQAVAQMMFVELMFWKLPKDVNFIQNDYYLGEEHR